MAKKHNNGGGIGRVSGLASGEGPTARHNLFVIDDEAITDPRIRDMVMCPMIDGEVKGHGLVPRDYTQHPREMFDPPSDLPLLSEEEINARIEEQERAQSSLQHLLTWEATDQDGDGYCHTADTEVLTEKGWVGWPDYDWSAPLGTVNPLTHALEFQQPFERHVYEYDGPMVYSTNRRIDFGVTPDHQMYVRKWDEAQRSLSDGYSFVRAGDMGWYVGLLHAPAGQIGTELVELAIPSDRSYDGDDLLALLALVVSDGYAGGTENTRNWVSFASFREDSRRRVEALAARVGFHECPSRPGVWVRYDAGALAEWVRENCYDGGQTGAKSKKVPPLVKWASQRQIKLFLDWFDDRNRSGRQFYSTSKRMIDDLQELHLRIGKRASIGRVPAKETMLGDKCVRSSEAFVLTVGEAGRLCLDRKKHIETDHYKGLVYCAAVPNHTLLTRRNGSVLISSNCWVYSTTGAVQALRTLMNAPWVRLNPHSLGAIIKRGRNEGGWCGLSAKGLREIGVASFEFWKEHSRDLSQDNAACRANMAQHKITEEWTDLTRDIYDQNLTLRQIDTLAVCNVPMAWDFNWWGHSVMGGRVINVEAGSRGRMPRNSWGQGWGDKGWTVLRGSKAIPDGALAIRVTIPSMN